MVKSIGDPGLSLQQLFDYANQLQQAAAADVASLVAEVALVFPEFSHCPNPYTGHEGHHHHPTSDFQSRPPSELNLQSALDPRAMAVLSAMRDLPAQEYLSPEEARANFCETHGARYWDLSQRYERSMSLGMMGLLAALQGGDLNDIVRILGSDNRGSRKLAQSIQQLAQALQAQPPDMLGIKLATMQAEWDLIGHIAQGPGEQKLLEHVYKNIYGMPGPDQWKPDRYYGQGAFGNQVESRAPGSTDVKPGTFATGDPSRAGLSALDAARSQLGVREASGNNDGLPSQRYAGGRREPWCADFVSWCFRQTGQPLPGNQRALASVSHMESQMKRAGRFHTGTPQPGDIIFFGNRGRSDAGSGRHVGIVERVENGKVYTIEGNTSNAVRRRSYDLSSSRISGYGRA